MSWRPLSQEQNLNFSTEHWWLYPKCLSRKRMKSSHVKLGSFFAKKVGLQFCSSLSLFMNERNCPNSRSAFCRKFSAEKMFRRTSVTRLGDFWKFLSTNLLTKVAQKVWWLLGFFEIDQFMQKLLWIWFRQLMETFGNIWATSGQTGLEQHLKCNQMASLFVHRLEI